MQSVLLTGAILAAFAACSVKANCCMPDQLEANIGLIDGMVLNGTPRVVQVAGSISIDYIHRMMASQSYLYSKKYTVISDYNKNLKYVIEGTSCKTIPIDTPLLKCIPESSPFVFTCTQSLMLPDAFLYKKYIGKISVGISPHSYAKNAMFITTDSATFVGTHVMGFGQETLTTKAYKFSLTKSFEVYLSVTSNQCIPAVEVIYGNVKNNLAKPSKIGNVFQINK